MYLAKEPNFKEGYADDLFRNGTFKRTLLFREEAEARKYTRGETRGRLRQLLDGLLSDYLIGCSMSEDQENEICLLLSGDPDNGWNVYSLDPMKTEFSDETLDRVLDIVKVFDWDVEPIEPQD